MKIFSSKVGTLINQRYKKSVGNLIKTPTCEKQQPKKKKKIEKTHAKENNHMHKTIFTWFGNLPTSTELQEFHYYQGKVQKCGYKIFHSNKKHDNNPIKP